MFIGLGTFEVVFEALEEVNGFKALISQPEFLNLFKNIFGIDDIIGFMLVGFIEGKLGGGELWNSVEGGLFLILMSRSNWAHKIIICCYIIQSVRISIT